MAAARGAGEPGRRVLDAYLVLFFACMLAPLLVMAAVASNAHPQPSVTRWDGLTPAWFGRLAADERLVQGLLNSLLVGAGVVAASLASGLAGALVLLDTAMVSPILAPGVILGVSTLVLWRRAGRLLVLRRITLPFLAPAAAGIAFLQSFENYDTTVFAVGGDRTTLVTEVGSGFRFGLSPAPSALGVLSVLATVAAAAI